MLGSGKSRRLPATERRAQLIDVGRAVFAQLRYEATPGEEIAGRAQGSKPVLSRHLAGERRP